MAGDWIKFEVATLDKPEVLLMADLLGTTADDVVGKLLRVWAWFDKQSRDGNAGSVTGVTLHKFVDRLVSSQGFAASMVRAGWLTDTGLPNFERHNGESAKNRALTRERAKRFRNAEVTPVALPEKRREEKKEIQEPRAPRKRAKTSIPADFGLSERVIDWAKEKGFGNLQQHLDAFRLKAVANGYQYADWDSALMNAISSDWAGLRGKGAPAIPIPSAHSTEKFTKVLQEMAEAKERAVPMPEAFREQLAAFTRKALS